MGPTQSKKKLKPCSTVLERAVVTTQPHREKQATANYLQDLSLSV